MMLEFTPMPQDRLQQLATYAARATERIEARDYDGLMPILCEDPASRREVEHMVRELYALRAAVVRALECSHGEACPEMIALADLVEVPA